jgi:hypothetical protein
MGFLHDEAAHHLVPRRYLVLEVYAAVGEGGIELGDRSFFALAAGRLVGNQFSVADVVGGEHLIKGVQVSLDSCLQQTAGQCHVLFCRRHSGFLLLANPRTSPRGRLQLP